MTLAPNDEAHRAPSHHVRSNGTNRRTGASRLGHLHQQREALGDARFRTVLAEHLDEVDAAQVIALLDRMGGGDGS